MYRQVWASEAEGRGAKRADMPQSSPKQSAITFISLRAQEYALVFPSNQMWHGHNAFVQQLPHASLDNKALSSCCSSAITVAEVEVQNSSDAYIIIMFETTALIDKHSAIRIQFACTATSMLADAQPRLRQWWPFCIGRSRA